MEEYQLDISELCRPGTWQAIETAGTRCNDAAVADLKPFFGPEDDMLPPLLCTRAMVAELARRVVPEASTDYVIFLLGQIWTVRGAIGADDQGAPFLAPDYLADLRRPYDVLPYAPPFGGPSRYPQVWFGCARILNHDIREQMQGKITWDWGFAPANFSESETWAYAKYLATYDDPEALKGIETKLREVVTPNIALVMLSDLMRSPVVSPGMRAIVQSYSDDPRETDSGIDGIAGVPLSRKVEQMLARSS